MARKRPAREGDPGSALPARVVSGRLEDLDGVEVLCGIPSYQNAPTIGNVVRAVEAGLRRTFPDARSAIVVSDGGGEDGTVDRALRASTGPGEGVYLIDPKGPIPPATVMH